MVYGKFPGITTIDQKTAICLPENPENYRIWFVNLGDAKFSDKAIFLHLNSQASKAKTMQYDATQMMLLFSTRKKCRNLHQLVANILTSTLYEAHAPNPGAERARLSTPAPARMTWRGSRAWEGWKPGNYENSKTKSKKTLVHFIRHALTYFDFTFGPGGRGYDKTRNPIRAVGLWSNMVWSAKCRLATIRRAPQPSSAASISFSYPTKWVLWSANLWHWMRVSDGTCKKIGNASHWQEFAHHLRYT